MMSEWRDYQKLILHELERMDERLKRVEVQLGEIRTDIALLKLKSGLWGLVAGTLPVIGMVLWSLLK